ncbi:hypothetical protein [Sphingomonas sp.]|uniref:hypothetical protein n=1 Tax=Sphingomonas sp. TaxID=28214 RepID=UPI001E0A4E46|nr:hypothetical protein [Sphingomonas sp.]MBX9796344.1 hypothetical protein [Sphingomonas sp.]
MVPLSPLAQTLMSIVMLAALLCLAGGAWRLWHGGDRRKGALLIILALVMVGNVLMWSVS